MKEEGRLAGKKMISRNGGGKGHDGGVTVTYVINKCYLTHLIPKKCVCGDLVWCNIQAKKTRHEEKLSPLQRSLWLWPDKPGDGQEKVMSLHQIHT